MDAIETWRRRYGRQGVASIPLPSFSKGAVYDFTIVTPSDAWARYGSSAGNIGIMAGNTLAILEQDTTAATSAIDTWAGGLGLELPTVYSATPGHRHSYLRCLDIPDGLNVGKLAADSISDFRAHKAYVVAPCSAVYIGAELRRYKWARYSDPELLMVQRPIKWRDLEPLLLRKPGDAGELLDALPLRLLWRPAPDALQRLELAARAPKGLRSETEAAALCGMAVAGWDFDAVRSAFVELQPGHYRDAGKHGDSYLWHTWRTGITMLAAQGERPAIAASYHAASSAAWPGSAGGSDRAVYLAMLAICWQAGDWAITASVRDLEQHAKVTAKTASLALKRLRRRYGLLEPAHDAERGPCDAQAFRVSAFVSKGNTSHILRAYSLEQYGLQRQTGQLSSAPAARGESELWARARLGQSAAMVYAALGAGPLTVAELQAATGKSRRTVYRALATLQAHGLADDAGHGWQLGPVDLAEVAAAYDCEQAAQRRRLEHEREREAWRRRMLGYGPADAQGDAEGRAASMVDAGAFDVILGQDWQES